MHKIIVIIILYAGISACTLSPSTICYQNGVAYKYPPIKKNGLNFMSEACFTLILNALNRLCLTFKMLNRGVLRTKELQGQVECIF